MCLLSCVVILRAAHDNLAVHHLLLKLCPYLPLFWSLMHLSFILFLRTYSYEIVTAENNLATYVKRKSDYYGTVARPVKNHNDSVTLWYGQRLIQVDVDEATNTLITSM